MNTTGKKQKALRTVDRTSFDTNRNSAEKTLSSLHCLIKYYSFFSIPGSVAGLSDYRATERVVLREWAGCF